MEIKLDDSEISDIKELKSKCRQYFSHYSLFVTLGTIWIICTSAGYLSHHLSILLFICCLAMIKPILGLTSRVLRTSKYNKERTLKLSTKIIAIGVIFGLSAVFFPFVNNINLFYPAFGTVASIIFLTIFLALRMKIHLFASAVQLAEGIYLGSTFPDNFMLAGYIEGYSMLTIGVFCGLLGKITKYRILGLKSRNKQKLQTRIAAKRNLSINKSRIKEKI